MMNIQYMRASANARRGFMLHKKKARVMARKVWVLDAGPPSLEQVRAAVYQECFQSLVGLVGDLLASRGANPEERIVEAVQRVCHG